MTNSFQDSLVIVHSLPGYLFQLPLFNYPRDFFLPPLSPIQLNMFPSLFIIQSRKSWLAVPVSLSPTQGFLPPSLHLPITNFASVLLILNPRLDVPVSLSSYPGDFFLPRRHPYQLYQRSPYSFQISCFCFPVELPQGFLPPSPSPVSALPAFSLIFPD